MPSSAVHPKITQAQCKLLVFSTSLRPIIFQAMTDCLSTICMYTLMYTVCSSKLYILQKDSLKNNGTKLSGEPKINQMFDCFDPIHSSNLLPLNPLIVRKGTFD